MYMHIILSMGGMYVLLNTLYATCGSCCLHNSFCSAVDLSGRFLFSPKACFFRRSLCVGDPFVQSFCKQSGSHAASTRYRSVPTS